MPHISIRGTEMPESPIRKLAPLAEAAKARGIRVYHLNIGQPDLPTPRAALDAIRNIDRTVLEYSPSQGYRSYREKLVGYYKKYDINLTADDIIITTGGSEAVLFARLCEPQGHTAVCCDSLCAEPASGSDKAVCRIAVYGLHVAQIYSVRGIKSIVQGRRMINPRNLLLRLILCRSCRCKAE